MTSPEFAAGPLGRSHLAAKATPRFPNSRGVATYHPARVGKAAASERQTWKRTAPGVAAQGG